jgi:hypothetical protein
LICWAASRAVTSANARYTAETFRLSVEEADFMAVATGPATGCGVGKKLNATNAAATRIGRCLVI